MSLKNYTTKIQGKKVEFLLEKGGMVATIVVKVKMSDNAGAEIDGFGRVIWLSYT